MGRVSRAEPWPRKKTVLKAARKKSLLLYNTIIVARRRERQRDWEIKVVVIAHGSVEICKATPIGLVDKPKNLVRARDGPRSAWHLGMHVDASRDFYFIFSY